MPPSTTAIKARAAGFVPRDTRYAVSGGWPANAGGFHVRTTFPSLAAACRFWGALGPLTIWRTNTSFGPRPDCPGKTPFVYPAMSIPEGPAATPSATSYPELPSCVVHDSVPPASYFRRYASQLPALVSPGNAPLVYPVI